MTYYIYNETNASWEDVTQLFHSRGIDGSKSDIEGTNSDRVIQNAMLIRDRLATKSKWTFTTIPLTVGQAASMASLLSAEYIKVRTDYFGSMTVYDAICSGLTWVYLDERSSGEKVKLTFSIEER